MRDLVSAIRHGGTPEVGAADGLVSLAVALSACEADTCGEPIRLPPEVDATKPHLALP
jgi:hypothetical protein